MASAYDGACAVVKEYLYYMETIKGRSKLTVKEHFYDLRLFFRFIKVNRGLFSEDQFDQIPVNDIDIHFIKSITSADIYEFLYYITDAREASATSRARKLSTLKTFYKYLTTNAHLLNDNPVKDIEVPAIKKSLPKYLTLDESLKLLSSIPNDDNFARNYCIVTLFLNCGMRISELIGIDLSDISDNTVRITGKGNKERVIYLNDACMASLRDYLPVRAKGLTAVKDIEALFLSRNGTRISKRRVQQIVESCLQGAGLDKKGLSTHKLRHTAATLMYQHGGVDIRVLSEILGHEHVSTTEIYTHVTNSQVENAMNRSPLAHVSKNKK